MDIIDILIASRLDGNGGGGSGSGGDGTANELLEQAKQLLEQSQQTLQEAKDTVQSANDTITEAQQAVERVSEIEAAAQAAADKAQTAADSFDQMKEDLLAAARELVAEAVAAEVQKNLEDLLAQFEAFKSEIDGKLGGYDERIGATENEQDRMGEMLGLAQADIEELQDRIDNLEQNGGSTGASNLDVTLTDSSTSLAEITTLTITKNESDITSHDFKNYTSIGPNTDGSMTQKAITEYITQVKTELEAQIEDAVANGNGNPEDSEDHGALNGAGLFFGTKYAGRMAVVGNDGFLTVSELTEKDLMRMSYASGTVKDENILGLECDYQNKTFTRIQGAASLGAGSGFDVYPEFGGRRRVMVDDDGQILAFDDDDNFVEDGSQGQIMVYQPKFYYARTPMLTSNNGEFGQAIMKESIMVSDTQLTGFVVHPLFLDVDGNELDYVLLPAYEGCAQRADRTYVLDDAQDVDFTTSSLSSISGVKPMSGTTQSFTLTNAQAMAAKRGEGWQITNMEFESAQQMLMSIEYGSMNLQQTLGRGVSDYQDEVNKNNSVITGSTSELKSKSGEAVQSYLDHNTFSDEDGKKAISYRGVENPYGNIYRFINNVTISNASSGNGGVVSINEKQFNSKLPGAVGWISTFSYDENLDWAFIPTIISGISSNSSLPIGDFIYIYENFSGTNIGLAGGKYSGNSYNGAYYYTFAVNDTISNYALGARLMHKPKKDSTVYISNIQKWKNKWEANELL